MKKLFFILSGLVLLASCRENITYQLPKYDSRLAVYCVLNPDSLPVVFLNETRSYFDYSDTTNSLHFVKDATVIITDNTTGQKETLKLDTGHLSTSSPFPGPGGQNIPIWFYKGSVKPIAGHDYSLDITDPKNRHLTGKTMVPLPVPIDNITYHNVDGNFGSFLEFKITFNDPPENNSYTVTGFMPDSFFNPQTGNWEKHTYKETSYGYYSDAESNGHKMEITWQNNLASVMPGDSSIIYVSLNNLTRETADYIQSVQNQSNSMGDPFSEPIILKSNVEGGLGVFGAETSSPQRKVVVIW